MYNIGFLLSFVAPVQLLFPLLNSNFTATNVDNATFRYNSNNGKFELLYKCGNTYSLVGWNDNSFSYDYYDGSQWVKKWDAISDLQHIIFADTSISLSNDKYGSITLDIPYKKVVSINLSYADNVYTYAPVLSYKNVNGKTNINIVCNAANTSTYGIRVSYLK